jgi:DNA-binding ferritin-like protein
MAKQEEFERLKEEYQNIQVPEQGLERIESAVKKAKADKRKQKRRRMVRSWGIGAAAMLALFLLPNSNQNVAYAMENIPVIGGLFKVITIKDYSHIDEHNQAKIKVPEIVASTAESKKTSDAVSLVNQSVEQYTNELVDKFKADMVQQGYLGLDISYETKTDTDKWFTLAIYAVETKASGYEFRKYYQIDKTTGQTATIKDMFKENTDYVTVISNEIKKQMKQQVDAGTSMYWLEGTDGINDSEAFRTIKNDQNFYVNQDGNIVIVFDEYEVGPGYIGCPEFVIPSALVKDIRK